MLVDLVDAVDVRADLGVGNLPDVCYMVIALDVQGDCGCVLEMNLIFDTLDGGVKAIDELASGDDGYLASCKLLRHVEGEDVVLVEGDRALCEATDPWLGVEEL